MKRILVIFLILIPILCSCSTLGKKVYYENEDVIIYEPDSAKVEVNNKYIVRYKASTNLVLKNKKNKTVILAFMYTISNRNRDLLYPMPKVENFALRPNETKKVSIEYNMDESFDSAYNEGYKNINILKDSIVVLSVKELRGFVIEYIEEYNRINKHQITSDPYSDDILYFVSRYLYNKSPRKIYTVDYLNEKFYNDSLFGLYCEVPRGWNRKIRDNKYVFFRDDIMLSVSKLNITKQNQSILDIIDESMIGAIEDSYNTKLIIDDRRNLSVFRKDFSEYDSVLIKGHFNKDNSKTNVWLRFIERDSDYILAILTENENQQYYSKWELAQIIESFSEFSHEDDIDYKKG